MRIHRDDRLGDDRYAAGGVRDGGWIGQRSRRGHRNDLRYDRRCRRLFLPPERPLLGPEAAMTFNRVLFAMTVLLGAGSAAASQAPSATAVVDPDGTLARGYNA